MQELEKINQTFKAKIKNQELKNIHVQENLLEEDSSKEQQTDESIKGCT